MSLPKVPVPRVHRLKYARLEEVAAHVARAPAAQDRHTGGLLRRLEVALDLVERLPVDHRAHEVPEVRRVSDLDVREHLEHALAHAGPETVGEIGARRRAAFLSLVLKRAAHQ